MTRPKTKTETVQPCIRGRLVAVRFRERTGPRGLQREFNDLIGCPITWTKTRFLDYCRARHPGETVRLLNWDVGKVWLVSPHEMARG